MELPRPPGTGTVRAPVPDVFDLDIYRTVGGVSEHYSYGVYWWQLSGDQTVISGQSGVQGPIRLIAKPDHYWDVVESPPIPGISRKGWVTCVERWRNHES